MRAAPHQHAHAQLRLVGHAFLVALEAVDRGQAALLLLRVRRGGIGNGEDHAKAFDVVEAGAAVQRLEQQQADEAGPQQHEQQQLRQHQPAHQRGLQAAPGPARQRGMAQPQPAYLPCRGGQRE
jgi:hypothetical protein